MNIAIYDAEHYEGIYPLIKLFGTSQNRLTIFTSSSSIDRLHEMLKGEFFHYKWIVIEPKSRNKKYFKRVSALLKVASADFVFFNTIATHQYHYAKLIKEIGPENCVVTVHNINNFFEPSPRIGIKTFFNNIGKKFLKKHLIYFNVINDTLLPKLNDLLSEHQHGFSIPGGISENEILSNSIDDKIKLVIPGTVDARRRNYEQIFQLAKIADEIGLNLDITIVGGIHSFYGVTIMERIKNEKFKNTIIHYTDYAVVPQPLYDNELTNSNYIWLPSTIHFQMEKGLQEIYGVTKSSGNVFDIVRSGKPYLAPNALLMPENLQKSGYHYQNLNVLAQYLKEIQEQPVKYNSIAETAKYTSKDYTVENIRKNLPDLFKKFIN